MCYGLAPLRMPPTTAPDRPVTYSNPQGTALTQIRDNVWWGERSFYPHIPGLTGFDVACKMTVIKLKNSDLWVWAAYLGDQQPLLLHVASFPSFLMHH